jgi:putative photosynthetic complex assembly protein
MPQIHFEEDAPPTRVPRAMLLAAAAMMLLAMAMALTARVTDAGSLRIATEAHPEAARDLRFADRADGAVVVTDAQTGQTVHVLEPGVNSFIRGALRGLAFDRRRDGIGPEAPFRLARWPGGRLTLHDPATGTVLDLGAYGFANRDAFAQLLPKVSQSITVNLP